MVIVKIECSVLAEAMQKYSTLRMYMRDFQQGNTNIFISKAEDSFLETRDKNVLDFYLSLFDWGFNCQGEYTGRNDENGHPIFEDGDAKKFYDENPKGFTWKYLKVVQL